MKRFVTAICAAAIMAVAAPAVAHAMTAEEYEALLPQDLLQIMAFNIERLRLCHNHGLIAADHLFPRIREVFWPGMVRELELTEAEFKAAAKAGEDKALDQFNVILSTSGPAVLEERCGNIFFVMERADRRSRERGL